MEIEPRSWRVLGTHSVPDPNLALSNGELTRTAASGPCLTRLNVTPEQQG